MTSAVSEDARRPQDPAAHLGDLTRVILSFDITSLDSGAVTISELHERGFSLGSGYRAALKTHGRNAFGPRTYLRELAEWRANHPGHRLQFHVVTFQEPTNEADAVQLIMRGGRYPAFYADWIDFLLEDPNQLRRGPLVALGSALTKTPDPEWHGPRSEHVPYGVFEPSISRVGRLSVCEIATPFPADTQFLTVDLR